MSTSDGQKANQTTFNNAYISRTVDSNTVGKVDVENTDSANSGPTIQNIQREMNGSATFSGRAINGAKDEKPSWLDNGVGLSTNDLKDRSDALTTQMVTNIANILNNTNDVADIRTTTGTSDGDIDMGAFTGGVVTDNTDLRAMLQEIITALAAITDGLDFQGVWNANTNTPSLSSGTGTKGHFYIVDTAGSTNLDGITDWNIGDWAVFDGTVWRQVDNTDAVASVNSQTGVVALDTDDISEGATNKYVNTQSIDALTDVDTVSVAPTTGQSLVFDGSDWVPGTGGGSGTGGINYAESNPSAEIDTAGYQVYADAAGVQPVDGTGGATNVTLTRTVVTAEIIRGDASFKLAKDAVNRQGEGFNFGDVATDKFEIDIRDKGGRIEVSLDYNVTANYVSDDMQFFVYDVTNASLISVANDDDGKLLSPATNGSTFLGHFFATDSVEYRLIGHIASVSALAYDVFFDNVRIGPAVSQPGHISQGWTDYVPTGQWTSNTTYTGKWRRNGENIEVQGFIKLTGAPDSAIATLTLPTGLVIDTAKLLQTSSSQGTLGFGTADDDSAGQSYPIIVQYFTTTSVRLHRQQASSNDVVSGNGVNQSSPFIFANNDDIDISFTVPIENWENSFAISTTQANLQLITIAGQGNAGTVLTANTTDIDFTETQDTHGVWDGSLYTALRPMEVIVTGSVRITTSPANTLFAYINGTIDCMVGQFTATAETPISGQFTLAEGDTLSIRLNATATLSNSSTLHWIKIQSIEERNTFAVFGKNEFLAATSSAKTPGASSDYMLMTGSELALTPGTWLINGLIEFSSSGAVAYTFIRGIWSSSNGDDTSSAPSPALSADAGQPTVNATNGMFMSVPSANDYTIPVHTIRITVISDTTIYLVPQAVMGTAANSRVTTQLYAERVA